MPHELSFAPGPARVLTMHTPAAGFGDFLRALTSGDAEYRERALAAFDQVAVDA